MNPKSAQSNCLTHSVGKKKPRAKQIRKAKQQATSRKTLCIKIKIMSRHWPEKRKFRRSKAKPQPESKLNSEEKERKRNSVGQNL